MKQKHSIPYNPRLVAVQVIQEVVEGRSLTDSLASVMTKLCDSRDRAFLQALCYGVCRWYWRLDMILQRLLKKPFKAKDQDIHLLLLTGLYQLTDMRVPAHAAIYETVAILEQLNKNWAKGVVNGVLRTFQRLSSAVAVQTTPPTLPCIPTQGSAALVAEYSHPQWFIEQLQQAWPVQWQTILAANNEFPPFALRVNQRCQDRQAYLAILATKELTAHTIPETRQGILLEKPVDVESLPGFQQGAVSVQDGAAQLAVELLDLAVGQHVLDACAAPGGKMAAILEAVPEVDLTAVEKDAHRMETLRENLHRLQLQATCICSDVAASETWWDKRFYDRILLDAPCSGSGVIRRHPDIKLLRQPSDIAAAQQQWRLLESLWPLLQPEGIFLYATCSIFPEENAQLIEKFLTSHADAREEKIVATWGVECAVGRQILPGMHEMDGFYYARLRKMVS